MVNPIVAFERHYRADHHRTTQPLGRGRHGATGSSDQHRRDRHQVHEQRGAAVAKARDARIPEQVRKDGATEDHARRPAGVKDVQVVRAIVRKQRRDQRVGDGFKRACDGCVAAR